MDGWMDGSGMRVRQPRIMIVGIMRLMVNVDGLYIFEREGERSG